MAGCRKPRGFQKNVSDADLANIGWTRNDLYLFADDDYPDPSVYSDQDIEELARSRRSFAAR